MKYWIIFLIGLLFNNSLKSQEDYFADKWIDSVMTYSGFQEINKNNIEEVDLSKLLSNRLRFEGDPMSTYIGVFGPNYRIDFQLEVTKQEHQYIVTGKSKLQNNIRELKGEIKINKVLLRKQDYITDSLYIGLFDCILRESGNNEADGIFKGVYTLVFYRKDGEIKIFKPSSRDEPNFTNTFVGKWTNYYSNSERKCMFSFNPAGLYNKLPYCEDIYDYEFDDFAIIKKRYYDRGWENFNPKKNNKTDWWK